MCRSSSLFLLLLLMHGSACIAAPSNGCIWSDYCTSVSLSKDSSLDLLVVRKCFTSRAPSRTCEQVQMNGSYLVDASRLQARNFPTGLCRVIVHTLNASYNLLSDVDEFVRHSGISKRGCNLAELRKLDLSENTLRTLYVDRLLRNLAKLEELNLDGNPVTELRVESLPSAALRVLSLQRSRLAVLDANIVRLPSIKLVDFSHALPVNKTLQLLLSGEPHNCNLLDNNLVKLQRLRYAFENLNAVDDSVTVRLHSADVAAVMRTLAGYLQAYEAMERVQLIPAVTVKCIDQYDFVKLEFSNVTMDCRLLCLASQTPSDDNSPRLRNFLSVFHKSIRPLTNRVLKDTSKQLIRLPVEVRCSEPEQLSGQLASDSDAVCAEQPIRNNTSSRLTDCPARCDCRTSRHLYVLNVTIDCANRNLQGRFDLSGVHFALEPDMTAQLYVNLHGNRISRLAPPQDQVMLVALNVSQNEFHSVPSDLINRRLQFLDLRYNQLTDLPDVRQFPHVQELLLEGNLFSCSSARNSIYHAKQTGVVYKLTDLASLHCTDSTGALLSILHLTVTSNHSSVDEISLVDALDFASSSAQDTNGNLSSLVPINNTLDDMRDSYATTHMLELENATHELAIVALCAIGLSFVLCTLALMSCVRFWCASRILTSA